MLFIQLHVSLKFCSLCLLRNLADTLLNRRKQIQEIYRFINVMVDFKSQNERALVDLIKAHHPEVIINRVNLLNSPTEVWDQRHQHILH